jgi:hypothetical protein
VAVPLQNAAFRSAAQRFILLELSSRRVACWNAASAPAEGWLPRAVKEAFRNLNVS